jgi:NADPH-dependent glutamate synthase beta subunit-like oxidoreductase
VDLVLLAMDFLGPEWNGLLSGLGVKLTDRGNVWRDENRLTSAPGVFTAGDMQRPIADHPGYCRRSERGPGRRPLSHSRSDLYAPL